MDNKERIFDTMDLDEIRRLIGEEPAAPKAEPEAEMEEPAQLDFEAQLEAEFQEHLAAQNSQSSAEEVSAAEDAEQVQVAESVEEPNFESTAEEMVGPVENAAPAVEAETVRQTPPEAVPEAEPEETTEEEVPKQPRMSRGKRPMRVKTGVDQDVSRALEEHQQDLDEKLPKGFDAYTMLHDLVIILSALTLVFVFCVRLVGVAGVSMIPTFYDKDYLILQSNFTYKNIEQGDVVVLSVNAPGVAGPIVKRVIATEGQTVDIDFETGDVMVDGQILVEPYIYEPTYEDYGSMGIQYPVTVPEGEIFVMGDDRNHSADSRWSPIGCVRTDRVMGKVLFLVFPGRETDVYGNVTGKRDFSRIGAVS